MKPFIRQNIFSLIRLGCMVIAYIIVMVQTIRNAMSAESLSAVPVMLIELIIVHAPMIIGILIVVFTIINSRNHRFIGYTGKEIAVKTVITVLIAAVYAAPAVFSFMK